MAKTVTTLAMNRSRLRERIGKVLVRNESAYWHVLNAHTLGLCVARIGRMACNRRSLPSMRASGGMQTCRGQTSLLLKEKQNLSLPYRSEHSEHWAAERLNSAVEGEHKPLTGDVQELTGNVQELTGDVQELTGDVQELTGGYGGRRVASEGQTCISGPRQTKYEADVRPLTRLANPTTIAADSRAEYAIRTGDVSRWTDEVEAGL